MALACVLKVLSGSYSKGQRIDWRNLRCVLEVQYAAAGANPWDSRLLAILIRRYFQRAVANPKHELFLGFAVAECPSKTGFFKVLRKGVFSEAIVLAPVAFARLVLCLGLTSVITVAPKWRAGSDWMRWG
eukprot:1957812-Rhodomonas_salina.2